MDTQMIEELSSLAAWMRMGWEKPAVVTERVSHRAKFELWASGSQPRATHDEHSQRTRAYCVPGTQMHGHNPHNTPVEEE